ncbi:MAG TPA: sigma-70 family RNA polymerase sigma factor, partial [Gemmataceae bacterium]
MSTARSATLLRHLHQWAAGRDEEPQSDRELLRSFTATHDEAAFTVLVGRHGPMVLSVCRRVLARPQDVEDAFQAAFLVLIRKADSSHWRDSVGGWLHRVALRIALHLRADAAHHAAEARRGEEGVVVDPLEQMTARELLAAFDEELARLPDRYREPLVLCHLAGQTQEETARRLGVSLSTVRRRLEHGRKLLHGRLTRRGLALPAALGISAAAAVIPAPLRGAAMQAIHGNVSARAAVLAEGILKTAILTPMKLTAAVLLTLGVLAGAGLAASHFLARKPAEDQPLASAPPDKPKSEKAERVDLYGDPLPPGALRRMGTVRFRHRGFLGSVAFSPDGKTLAAGGYSGVILLYDAATGRKLREMSAIANQFPALAFAPDGKTLASAGSKTLQIWDAGTGKELRRFDAEVDDSYSHHFIIPLVYSPDGKTLASVAPDHSVRIWDAKTGKELVKLQGHQYLIHCLAFAPDGKTLFSAGGDGTRAGSVRVWQTATGKELRKFSLHQKGASGQPDPLCFSPDGKRFVFAAYEHLPPKKGVKFFTPVCVVTFLDLDTGEVRRKLEPREGRFKSAAYSPDGKLLATMHGVRTITGNHQSEHNNRIQVREAATGKPLFDFPAYAEQNTQWPCGLAFSPDGKRLAAAATASSLHVWDTIRGRELLEKPETHHDGVRCVAYAPDGQTLASAGADRDIVLWDTATGREKMRLRGHEGEIVSLAFSPDGKLLASAAHFSDQSVRLWDVTTGKELRRHLVPSEPQGNGYFLGVTPWAAFAANGKVLAAGGTDRKVRLWDVATGKELLNQDMRGLPAHSKQEPNGRSEWVYDLAFAADGRVLALSIDSTVHIVDAAAGRRLFHFEKEAAEVLALSLDGKTLACGGGGSFRLVEIAGGKDLHKVDLPEPDGIHALAFSPDGRTLAVSAAAWTGNIYLFDVRSGEKLLRLPG